MKQLSIIIVSYNTRDLLDQCLKSFYDPQEKRIEVIIVDNNSSDDSVAFIKKNYPQIELIENKDNEGFAKANNQGINLAQGELVLLLNSDTLSSPESLLQLIPWMKKHPKVGIASPLLLNPDQSIQPNGGNLPNLINIATLMLFLDDLPVIGRFFPSYQITDRRFFQKTQAIGWVSGAALCIRRECFEAIGLLDEKIFMYAEDTDWCYRAWQKNWQVWTLAQPSIIHIAHGSGAKKNAILGEYKGLLYYFDKHKSAWQKGLLAVLLKLGAAARMVVFGKILGDRNRYDIYKEALSLVR